MNMRFARRLPALLDAFETTRPSQRDPRLVSVIHGSTGQPIAQGRVRALARRSPLDGTLFTLADVRDRIVELQHKIAVEGWRSFEMAGG